MTRLARLGPPAAVAAAALAVAAGVGLVDPNEPGHYPRCPFLAATGAYCPGCGSLRAVHALVQGRLGEAIGLNALLVLVALPTLLVLWGGWAARGAARRPRRRVAPPALLWALLAAVAAFGVLRNLPVGAALAP